MESIRQKAEDYSRRAKLKNPGNPAELKQAHDEIIGYLRALGAEYPIDKALEVLALTGHYPTLVSGKDGFAVAIAVDETDVVEGGVVTAFAIVYPGEWFETPGNAIENYLKLI